MKEGNVKELKSKYEKLLQEKNDISDNLDKFNLFKNDVDIQKYLALKSEIKALMFEMAAKEIDIYSESDTRLDYYKRKELDMLNAKLASMLTNEEIARKIKKYNDMLTYFKNNKILDDDSIIKKVINSIKVTSDENRFMIVGFTTDVDGETKW